MTDYDFEDHILHSEVILRSLTGYYLAFINVYNGAVVN